MDFECACASCVALYKPYNIQVLDKTIILNYFINATNGVKIVRENILN